MEIPPAEVRREKEIVNSGGQAIIYFGSYANQRVAIKRFTTKNDSLDFRREKDAFEKLVTLRHPNIIRLLGVISENRELILEWAELGSLQGALASPSFKPVNDKLALDIACGLEFLHRERVFHLDMKSANVLLCEGGVAKIADFGLARLKNSNLSLITAGMHTAAYVAPECTEEEGGVLAGPLDIYAYGIILWEIVTRKVPFQGFTAAQIPLLVHKGKRPAHYHTSNEPIPLNWKTLIETCWAQVPSERPNAEDLVRLVRDLNSTQENDFKQIVVNRRPSVHVGVAQQTAVQKQFAQLFRQSMAITPAIVSHQIGQTTDPKEKEFFRQLGENFARAPLKQQQLGNTGNSTIANPPSAPDPAVAADKKPNAVPLSTQVARPPAVTPSNLAPSTAALATAPATPMSKPAPPPRPPRQAAAAQNNSTDAVAALDALLARSASPPPAVSHSSHKRTPSTPTFATATASIPSAKPLLSTSAHERLNNSPGRSESPPAAGTPPTSATPTPSLSTSTGSTTAPAPIVRKEPVAAQRSESPPLFAKPAAASAASAAPAPAPAPPSSTTSMYFQTPSAAPAASGSTTPTKPSKDEKGVVISSPFNFRHVSHVGFTATGQFEVKDLQKMHPASGLFSSGSGSTGTSAASVPNAENTLSPVSSSSSLDSSSKEKKPTPSGNTAPPLRPFRLSNGPQPSPVALFPNPPPVAPVANRPKPPTGTVQGRTTPTPREALTDSNEGTTSSSPGSSSPLLMSSSSSSSLAQPNLALRPARPLSIAAIELPPPISPRPETSIKSSISQSPRGLESSGYGFSLALPSLSPRPASEGQGRTLISPRAKGPGWMAGVPSPPTIEVQPAIGQTQTRPRSNSQLEYSPSQSRIFASPSTPSLSQQSQQRPTDGTLSPRGPKNESPPTSGIQRPSQYGTMQRRNAPPGGVATPFIAMASGNPAPTNAAPSGRPGLSTSASFSLVNDAAPPEANALRSVSLTQIPKFTLAANSSKPAAPSPLVLFSKPPTTASSYAQSANDSSED